MLRLLILLLLISSIALAQKRRMIEIDSDTTTTPTSGYYGLAVKNNKLYAIPYSGNNIMIGPLTTAEYNSLWDSRLSSKLTPIGDGKLLSQSYGTLTAAEGVSTYLRIVSGPPSYPPSPDIYYRGLSASVFNVTKGFTINDSFGEEGQVLTSGGDNGTASWSYLVDTLNARPVLSLSPQAAELIPEDHHLVIEPDYIPARSSGNSYFDTLRANFFFYNILKDSLELKLTDFDTLFKSNVTFNILFFGSDHSDSLFVHDSTSILYFSDTVYAYAGGNLFKSNYLSSDHSLSYFRISPFQAFQLYWVRDERKYYITKKPSYEFNY
ncbi:MAG: hypothetical protein NXI00_11020 [Cytophagales bacterium]|nr:hypothetical protein [Cytophagales bacterium]